VTGYRMIIGSLGTWRGQAIQNSGLRLLGQTGSIVQVKVLPR